MPSAFSRRQFVATAVAAGLISRPVAGSNNPCAGQDGEDGIVWHRTYGEDESEDLTDAVPDGDGYALVGIDRDAETSGRSWLRRVDGDGREQWRREYGEDERLSVRSVAGTADDGFLLAGTVGQRRDAQFVTKADADGDEEWTTTVDVRGRDTFVAERSDETIVLCASMGRQDPTFPHLSVLDAGGEVSRSRTFDEDGGRQIRAGVVADDSVVLAGTDESEAPEEGWLWRVAVDGEIELERSKVFERRIVAVDRFEEGGLVVAGVTPRWLARFNSEWEVEWGRTEFDPQPHIVDVTTVSGGVAACGYHWGEGCARPPWAFRADDDGTGWDASADETPRLRWESALPAGEDDRVVVAGTDRDGDGSTATLSLVEESEASGEETTTSSGGTTAADGPTTRGAERTTTDGPTDGTATPSGGDGTTADESTADGLDGFGLGAGVAALTAALGHRVRRHSGDD